MAEKPTYEELEQKIHKFEQAEFKYKRAEVALRKSEVKYRLLADNTVDCIWLMDMDLVFTYVNPAIYKMTGFTTREWIGSKLEDHCDKQNFEKMVKIALGIIEKLPDKSEVVFEATLLKKNKDPLYVEIIGKILHDEAGNPVGLHGVTRDISERKRSEKALRKERDKAQKYLDISGVMFVGLDRHQNVTLVNQKACNVLGYKQKEILGKNWFDNFIPENRKVEVKASYSRLMAEELELSKKFEFPVLTKNAVERVISWHNTILKDEDAKIVGTLSSGEDITQRKLTEQALLKSEESYRLLADNVTDNIWVYDLETLHFSYVSPSVLGITGFTAEEATGFQLEDTLTPTALKLANKILTEELIAASQHFDPTRSRTLELEQNHKSGATVWTEVSVQFIYDREKRPTAILGVTRDIRERRRLQSKLLKSQKMESIGLLAGGVAHDLNNVLSGIVSYPELILMDLPEDNKLRKPLEMMMAAGHRAVAIVQDLLTVARGVATTKEPLNLNELVNDYLDSPEFSNLKQFDPVVSVKTNLGTDLLNIIGSQVHIRKVVMNLVANASEAIKGIGNVMISTGNLYIDKPLKGYDDVSIGEYVVLSIFDDGPGIPANDLERIFEPFYTTKMMGRSGTGLGLAVVWNVMQDHKGYIDVKTDENGTTFEVYFPITREEICEKNAPLSIQSYKGSGETILVVDDEESQREISCKILDILGYKTKAVPTGEEAVAYLKKNTVDLLLLDMIMDPGINGRETYKRVIKIHPDQKAVIVSGFSETDDVKEAQRLGAGKYIKKPLTIEKIGLAVKEELEK